MNSRYKYTHRVARVLARCTQGVPKEYPRGSQGVAKSKDLLSTCQVLAKGMATGLRILLKNKMTRYFLRHQNNLFWCGANMRLALNICHLPLYTRIPYELTARSQRDYGSLSTRFLRPLDGVWRCNRLVVTLLLMLVLGVSGMWGQTGIWYIANDNSTSGHPGNVYSDATDAEKYYLVPARPKDPPQDSPKYRDVYYSPNYNTQNGDPEKPFLTTHFISKPELDAVWVVTPSSTSGYYNVIHVKTGKYVIHELPLPNEQNRRKVVHLQTPDNGDYSINTNDYYNFAISGSENYLISVKNPPSSHKYWNPTGQNNNDYWGNAADLYKNALVGLYSGTNENSIWHFENATLAAPTISDVSTENNRVTITENNELPAGYNYRYTFSSEGTPDDPTASSPILELDANNRYLVTTVGTLKVVVERYGVVLTGVATKVVAPLPMCGTPQISFDNSINEVTITPATSGDEIYYTLDGGTPTTSSTLYYAPFSISTETTVKAIGAKDGSLNSDIVTLIITKVATPTIINDGTNIVMDCATDKATIYYTTDGSDPLGTNKQTYSSGFTAPSAGTIIKAIAVKENCINSAETTFTVAETCQIPVISLNYQTGVVTITSATEGATIRYTLDGSEPNSSSTEYTSLTLTEAKTVKAKAFKDGLDPSAVTTESFSQVVTPTVQKDAVNNTITITSGTEGATLRYTMDNSTPEYISTAYTDPLTYDASNKLIKAKAFKDGMVPSAVGEGQYKLQLPAPTIIVGDNLAVTLSTVPEITGVTYKYSTDGSNPSSDYSSTITLEGPATIKAFSKHSDFENSSVTSAFIYYTNINYVLQQKECIDFFLTQANVDNNNYKRVTTTNIPSDDIVWHFENANDGYYYIVKNNSSESAKEYLCYESPSDNVICLVNSSDFQSSVDKDKFRFTIIPNGEYYNFKMKANNKYLQKNGGNNVNWSVNGTSSSNDKALWGIKAVPTTHAEMAALVNPLSFSPFTNATPCYYQIKSVKSVNDVNYYIAPVVDGKRTYAKGTDDSTDKTTRWYLKVAEETVWNTYYYVVNAETGLYMYFNGTAGSSNAVVVENKGTAEKYKFLIVKTANETGSYKYNIIPKELESQVNQVNNSLLLHDTPTNALKTGSSRNNDATQWIFVLDDTYFAPLDITQNSDEESNDYLKITIECPEGYSDVYDIYYTTNGTDPVIPALNTEPTAPTFSYSAAFLPAIDATTIKAVAVSKTDHSKSSSVVSFELPKCATPTVSSFAIGTVTLGTTTTGSSIYYTTNETDPVLTGETPSSSATAPEITCPTGKTTIKAVAARRGMQPSDAFTKEVIYMPTITFTGGDSYTYTGSEITPTLSSVKVEGSNTEYVDECIISGYDNDNRINVRTITVTITQNTTSSMLIYGTTTFEITQKALTITAGSDTKVYDGTALTKNSFTNTDLATGDAIASVTVTGSQTVVGNSNNVTSEAVIKKGETDVTLNYDITYANGTLTVTARPVTVTADNGEKIYDATELTKNTATATGLAEGHSLASVTVTGSQTVVGNSDNVPSAAVIQNISSEDVTANYEITYANGTLTVTARPVTVTAASDTKVYDGTPLANNSATASGLVDGHTLASVTVTGSQTEVGSSANIPSDAVIKNGDEVVTANYEITYVNGTLTVTKHVLTITADNGEKVYDGTALTKNTYTSEGLKTGDAIESVTITGSQTDVGSSDNVPSAAVIKNSNNENVTSNYDITYAKGTLTVTRAAAVVTADAKEKVYGDADPTFTWTATGLKGSDTKDVLTVSTSRADGQDIGEYTITPTGNAEQGNYNVIYATGKLTITRATATVTADNKTKGYGDKDPEYTATVTGLKYEDSASSITYTINRTETGESKGNYTIQADGNHEQGNYNVSYQSGVLTIGPKDLGQGDTYNTPVAGVHIDITKSGTTYGLTATYDNKPFDDDKTLQEGVDGGSEEDKKDYTRTVISDGTTGDYIVEINGYGNYTGTARATFINLDFFDTTPNATTQSEEAAAAYIATQDLQATNGVEAYYVTNVDLDNRIVEIAKVGEAESKPNYIPNGLPVLLLGAADTEGFTLKPYTGSETVTITDNILQVSDGSVDVTTPDYYIFYQGEFVLSMWGTGKQIKVGKFFVHPDGNSSSPAPAYGALRVVKRGETTKIDEIVENSQLSTLNSQLVDEWYTLDGQKLIKKPTRKGIYIQNGFKVVIK